MNLEARLKRVSELPKFKAFNSNVITIPNPNSRLKLQHVFLLFTNDFPTKMPF